ncbi:ATP-binding protein [Flavobacterium antarcticum]|uniref:sensor histidine kinase n=1 Tax=Flavobacterium antarcticum TaxID=271155 RepID=UPI0003B2E48B|nr:PAS domain-containing sensor histidine kinase [Flavobacterium antarcticum]
MKFLKKFNHLTMLKIALGISIFSIGYLITMFYFQMDDLKEYKHRIVMYNTANVNILHLESEIERDSYFAQTQVLNFNLSPQKTNLDVNYINTFLEKNNLLNDIDAEVLDRNARIKELVHEYNNAKNQLFTNSHTNRAGVFNSSVIALNRSISNYSTYLESQIRIYNDNYDIRIDNAKTSGFLIALISLVIFILSYVKMNEDLYELRKINDEILFMNETLSNAEMVAGFGSWKINTVQNKFIISDNFYRMLNLEPREREFTVEEVMNYIHPEDREAVVKLHKESFLNKETTTLWYRYLLPDGVIRHMVSTGKFLNNSKGELVKIGVNQDISELMTKTKELEENNAKLVSINSELESFNNIISHDLQEPLRKIQMFISRIESKEFLESASETTVTYFEKIKAASARMQNLMTDLVEYTRTLKAGRVFEEVDLNFILSEIQEELAFTTEEKNAKITVDQLPIISGTRFQIQQLFINLISNALKYVKIGVEPNIAVKLETLDSDVINDKTITGAEYHKITITDNGIGFEQKYADQLFILFKRLPTEEIYKGTGLGLAICKKIVDNHKGFITAVGFPNKGCVFTVYLLKKEKDA